MEILYDGLCALHLETPSCRLNLGFRSTLTTRPPLGGGNCILRNIVADHGARCASKKVGLWLFLGNRLRTQAGADRDCTNPAPHCRSSLTSPKQCPLGALVPSDGTTRTASSTRNEQHLLQTDGRELTWRRFKQVRGRRSLLWTPSHAKLKTNPTI